MADNNDVSLSAVSYTHLDVYKRQTHNHDITLLLMFTPFLVTLNLSLIHISFQRAMQSYEIRG